MPSPSSSPPPSPSSTSSLPPLPSSLPPSPSFPTSFDAVPLHGAAYPLLLAAPALTPLASIAVLAFPICRASPLHADAPPLLLARIHHAAVLAAPHLTSISSVPPTIPTSISSAFPFCGQILIGGEPRPPTTAHFAPATGLDAVMGHQISECHDYIKPNQSNMRRK
uniref:Uncharacterized protein n=1 Tax=Oryza meridionalis TaxID=40149 RepID=A0A0E0C8Y5_9ORYZ